MEDVNSNDKLAGNADPLAATLSKRDKRRAKNAAKKAAAKEADEGGSIIAGKGRSDGADDGHECKVCHSFFESRSKLYVANPLYFRDTCDDGGRPQIQTH